jgi:hypothetical protein
MYIHESVNILIQLRQIDMFNERRTVQFFLGENTLDLKRKYDVLFKTQFKHYALET